MIHSDQGTQFTSWAFTRRALDSGLLPSMGSVGDCYDNAVIESFWSRMQVELLDRQRWRTRVELANAIFEYLEIFHNRQRRHSALGMLTPVEFEAVINQRQRHEVQPADSTEPGAPQSLHQTQGDSNRPPVIICDHRQGVAATSAMVWLLTSTLVGGGDGNRTRVQGFADPCLNHSATPPETTRRESTRLTPGRG